MATPTRPTILAIWRSGAQLVVRVADVEDAGYWAITAEGSIERYCDSYASSAPNEPRWETREIYAVVGDALVRETMRGDARGWDRCDSTVIEGLVPADDDESRALVRAILDLHRQSSRA